MISNLTITGLEINDNCLKITYRSGGCDGESWELKLIDSGDVFESFPPQRDLILSLVNNEYCEALISKETIIDITELQVDGGQVQLNIVNTEDSILYTY